MMGYDVLFQDVDVVWYKNPLPFFQDKSSAIYKNDVYFQDDGSRQVFYAPYSANTGKIARCADPLMRQHSTYYQLESCLRSLLTCLFDFLFRHVSRRVFYTQQ